jgi:hypothetical protein
MSAKHQVRRHFLLVLSLGSAAVLAISGCDGRPSVPNIRPGVAKAADVALVRFTTCADALRNLRAAATAATLAGTAHLVGGASGIAGPAVGAAPAANAPAADGSRGSAQPATAPGAYSSTNDAVAGVDEPDLVKTDGQRIVTVIGGVLRVVNVATHQVTGMLRLPDVAGGFGMSPVNLLLSGDRAMVLFDQGYPLVEVGGGVSSAPVPSPIFGPRLLLVDLSAPTPQVIAQYTMDGALVDARQVGSVVRVVVRSVPRVFFSGPAMEGVSAGGMPVTAPAIGRAGIGSWLPRYQVTARHWSHSGTVGCADIRHPVAQVYSGLSMLTVLTFDLQSARLGDGLPVTIVADGSTVYSNGTSLYVAGSQQWSVPAPQGMPPVAGRAGESPTGLAGGAPMASAPPVTLRPNPAYTLPQSLPPQPAFPQQRTAIYKFSIAAPGRPVYEASGTVPGWLLGSAGLTQYALSEWNGALRVATTSGGAFGAGSWQAPVSAVYELEQFGSSLVIVGKVGGLGAGEQVYAVRFAGPAGYVVTFRQVDPLYTLDLSDPAQPRVTGELWLSGYSAYLDPIGATRMIGIGQSVGPLGETAGTQISLFDTADPAAPARLAVFRLPFGHSEAEFDPHAFLYWPATGMQVIPVQLLYGPGAAEALVLRVGDHSITEAGVIRQPAVPGWPGGAQIRRSLVAGGALWTLSEAGLWANGLNTLRPSGWVPFG